MAKQKHPWWPMATEGYGGRRGGAWAGSTMAAMICWRAWCALALTDAQRRGRQPSRYDRRRTSRILSDELRQGRLDRGGPSELADGLDTSLDLARLLNRIPPAVVKH